MSTEIEHAIIAAIKANPEPILGGDLWSCGAIDSLSAADGRVKLAIRLGFPAAHYSVELTERLKALALAVPQVKTVDIDVQWQVTSRSAKPQVPPIHTPIAQIKNIIAVASGKGGVGKSTTAVNLTLALAHEGAAVGILDADIYGPSQPRMLGLDNEKPTSRDGKTIEPPVAYGVKLMSIGLLVDVEQPMAWRGPMVTQALNQLLGDTRWGALDYLIVDMPPGTGDIQLTLAQRVPVSGAVIVTTPQDIALLDARKGLKMFQKVEVPVLGVVENMSTHVCSKCGHEEHIFGAGGGRRMAEQYGVELLGELPLDIRIREQADGGKPTVVAEPDSNLGRAYIELGRRVSAHLASLAMAAAPSITIENS
jgi:ATP-binding protein involved in chromosome partitioning